MSTLVVFRTLQAISDLRALALQVLNVSGDTLPLDAGQKTALHRLVTAERCVFDSDATFALLPALEALAADHAGATDAAFALSNAILMANALQGGDRQERAAALWSESAARLRRLPHRLRAPLAHAACCTSDRYRFSESAAPSTEDRISVDLAATGARLVEIARAASEEELQHIARADYCCGYDRHLPALRQVIFDQACVFSEAQGWYPSEVVELVSHVPSEQGFAVATAILLNHCIHKGDLQGSTDFRWENNAAAYLALPRDLREPILAGFRAIYETDDGWSPYYSAQFDSRDNRAVLLPPAAPELTRPG